jgi:hypothetical protein
MGLGRRYHLSLRRCHVDCSGETMVVIAPWFDMLTERDIGHSGLAWPGTIDRRVPGLRIGVPGLQLGEPILRGAFCRWRVSAATEALAARARRCLSQVG